MAPAARTIDPLPPTPADIVPGAVFAVDPDSVHLPKADGPGPVRNERWVAVVSTKRDCREEYVRTVLVVILSAGVEHYFPRHDALLEKGDGGVERKSIAQCDLVFPLLKDDILTGTYKGRVMTDTLNRIRAQLGNLIGLETFSASGRDVHG